MSTLSTPNGRIQWIDVLRGIAVFCIVLGHFTKVAGDFYMFVFSFHVQLFFFISGMFAAKTAAKSFKEVLRSLANRIVIPYIFLSGANIVFMSIYEGTGIGAALDMARQCFMGRRNALFAGNLWFFPCLALMTLLYWALQKVVKNPQLLLAACLVLSLGMRIIKEEPEWIWSADSAILYVFYYALGDYCMPYIKNFRYSALSKGKKVLFTVSAVGAAGFAAVWFAGFDYLLAAVGVTLPVVLHKLVRFFAAVVLIYAAMLLAYLLRRSTTLANWGRATFIISACELMGRETVRALLEMFDIQFKPYTQFKIFIYTILIVVAIYHIFARPFQKHFPQIFSRAADAPVFSAGTKEAE